MDDLSLSISQLDIDEHSAINEGEGNLNSSRSVIIGNINSDSSEQTQTDDFGIVADLNPNKEYSSSGIPRCVFIEDISKFMGLPCNKDVDLVLKSLDERLTKYRFMEINFQAKLKKLNSQLPDLERTLSCVDLMENELKSGNEFRCRYLLSDHVYMKASVQVKDSVNLWLGANILMTYPLNEARELLAKNINNAKKNIATFSADLDFCREMRTVIEVTIARVYNWSVAMKKTNTSDTTSLQSKN